VLYNDFVDWLEYAAEAGFDAICVDEHHSYGYGPMPSPNLIAASLSCRTIGTAICVTGNSLAMYNPPARVAEGFAMIDCISGGRLIAGFPVGTPMDTCYAYGTNPASMRSSGAAYMSIRNALPRRAIPARAASVPALKAK
jgi:alkanesulfonate monooxygenase SsuD/methylene tetrahydromethanopterin reductase-like flavin-dependent oxidoreductase (luciferase family)